MKHPLYRVRLTFAAISFGFVSLLSAGCAPPQTASFTQNVSFDPKGFTTVSVRVKNCSGRTSPGQNTEAVLTNLFNHALLDHGYTPVLDGARADVELTVIVDKDAVVNWQFEEIDRNGNQYSRGGLLARAHITGELSKGSALQWSAERESTFEVHDSNDSILEGAGRPVAEMLPYRVFPPNNDGFPYDPRTGRVIPVDQR
jgi:hypothetical protein